MPRASATNRWPALVMALLDSRGWTQTELGEAVGVSQQVISRWANGKATPSPQRVVEAADALGEPREVFLRAAGYLSEDLPPGSALRSGVVFDGYTDEEIRLLKAYADGLRDRRRRRRRP